MYAVVVTGGKQYRVMKGETLRVELIDAEPGAKVTATVKGHGRLEKVRIVKFRRRKHHRKQMGHRQHFTELEITGISA